MEKAISLLIVFRDKVESKLVPFFFPIPYQICAFLTAKDYSHKISSMTNCPSLFVSQASSPGLNVILDHFITSTTIASVSLASEYVSYWAANLPKHILHHISFYQPSALNFFLLNRYKKKIPSNSPRACLSQISDTLGSSLSYNIQIAQRIIYRAVQNLQWTLRVTENTSLQLFPSKLQEKLYTIQGLGPHVAASSSDRFLVLQTVCSSMIRLQYQQFGILNLGGIINSSTSLTKEYLILTLELCSSKLHIVAPY